VAGPPEMSLERLKGIETPQDIILFACGMEKNLGGFYTEVSGKTGDAETAQLLKKLAGIEEKHKDQLLDLYRSITEADDEGEAFETRVASGVLEGGLTTGEFMERVMGQEYSMDDVFSIAMMFEAQAMDLYMRYSEEIKEPDVKKLLHGLAQQEKEHLAALGELMNKKT
jgi:sulfur-carrier protein adenylyltransferase/sulfurtransferase